MAGACAWDEGRKDDAFWILWQPMVAPNAAPIASVKNVFEKDLIFSGTYE